MMRRLQFFLIISWMTIIGMVLWVPPGLSQDRSYSHMIVSFYDDVSWEEIQRFAEHWRGHDVTVITELPMFNCLVLKVPDHIDSYDLAGDPRVESVENDCKVNIQGAVQGQYASFIQPASAPPRNHYPWGILKLYDQPYDPWSLTSPYKRSNLHASVKLALTRLYDRRIRIAIFDTGVMYFHRNLFRVVKGGIDLVNMKKSRTRKFKGAAPLDDNGHGTYVAGIICAALDKKGNWGRSAPIDLYAVKILDEKAMGDLSSIIEGLHWAINKEIDIVNMSIGFREDSLAIRRAVRVAHQLGIVMVASVGNLSNWDENIILAADGGAADGGAANSSNSEIMPFSVMYPARYKQVIAVGASTPFGDLASFSNTGEEIDVLAPGAILYRQM